MKQNDKNTQYTTKVVIIGDASVGKSSILLKFCNNDFSPSLTSTVGIDIRTKSIQIGKTAVRLQLWDTAGQERFKNINQTYFRGAYAAILVYSITDPHSFKSIDSWVQQINENGTADTVKFLVGAKRDLHQSRVVQIAQGLQISKKYGMQFMEVSAKNGDNIKQLFQKVSTKVVDVLKMRHKNQNRMETNNRISLDRREDEKRKGKCKC